MESPPPEDASMEFITDRRVGASSSRTPIVRRKSWHSNEDGVLHELMDAVLESERPFSTSCTPSWHEPLQALEREISQMIERESVSASSNDAENPASSSGSNNFPWFALGRSPSVCFRIWQDCDTLVGDHEETRQLVCRAILCFIRVSHHRPELRRALMQSHALDITYICWLSSPSTLGRTSIAALWPHFSVNLLGSDVSSLIHALSIIYTPEYADDPNTSLYLAWTFKDTLTDPNLMDEGLVATLTAMSFLVNNHPQSLARAFEEVEVAQSVAEAMTRQLVHRKVEDDTTWDTMSRGLFLILHLTGNIRTQSDLVLNYDFLSILAEAFVESCRRGCTPVYWRIIMNRLIHSTLCVSRDCCASATFNEPFSILIRRQLDPIWQTTLARLRTFEYHDTSPLCKDSDDLSNKAPSTRKAELTWISDNARVVARLWEDLITASEAAKKLARGGRMKPRWSKAVLMDW